MDRVNYQDLIFQTLIHTTIISGVDDVIWEVVAWISKINAIEALTTVISNKDLPVALTCTKGIVCIGAEDEWFVFLSSNQRKAYKEHS